MASFEHDPITLIGLVLGIGSALFLGNDVIRAGAIGALLYLAYVVWIGGDFMAGRFMAGPLVVSMLLLASLPVFSKEHSPLTAIRFNPCCWRHRHSRLSVWQHSCVTTQSG